MSDTATVIEYPKNKMETHGRIYHEYLLMLIFLRAYTLQQKKRFCNFQLAAEVQDVGALDDIVFTAEESSKNRKPTLRCYYVQVKHHQQTKSITKADFLKEKHGSYSMLKYFSSFLQIRNNPEKITNSPNPQYVIFTTADIGDDLKDTLEEVTLADPFFEMTDVDALATSAAGRLQSTDRILCSSRMIQDRIVDPERNIFLDSFLKGVDLLKFAKRFWDKMKSELHLKGIDDREWVERATGGQLQLNVPRFYRFKPASCNKEIIINKLYEASESVRLAQKLARCVLDDKLRIETNDELFKMYQIPLERDVLDVKEGKFRPSFINGDTDFCQVFLEELTALVETKFPNIEKVKAIAIDIAERINRSSDYFVTFEDEIIEPVSSQLRCYGPVFLALEDKKTNSYKLRNIIMLSDMKLPKSVVVFRDTLHAHLNPDKQEELYKYEFIIPDLQLSDEEKYRRYFEIYADVKNAFPSEKPHVLVRKNFGFMSSEKSISNSENKIFSSELPNDIIIPEVIDEFLQRMIFAVSQPNEHELKELIALEAFKSRHETHRTTAFAQFHNYIVNWMNEKQGRYLLYEDAVRLFEQIEGRVWFDVLKPVENFVGRKREVDKLHELLQNAKTNQGEMKMAVLSPVAGLGGVGKTQLARKFAQEYRKEYHNVVWIKAECNNSMKSSFMRLRKSLQLKSRASIPELKEQVKEVYKYFADKTSLFIFDNAQMYADSNDSNAGIESFLPNLSPDDNYPFIVVTSVNREWPRNAEMLSLDVYTKEEAEDFVRKSLDILDSSQDDDIKQLIETLQYFPLALHQATSYIVQERKYLQYSGENFDIRTYLKLYLTNSKPLLDYHPIHSTDIYKQTTYSTWRTTFHQLEKTSNGKEAVVILQIMACLAPDYIPCDIFLEQIQDRRVLGAAVHLLCQYSLISNSTQVTDCKSKRKNSLNTSTKLTVFSMHQLLQEVVRLDLIDSGKYRNILKLALDLLGPQLMSDDACSEHFLSHAGAAWSNYYQLILSDAKVWWWVAMKKAIEWAVNFISFYFHISFLEKGPFSLVSYTLFPSRIMYHYRWLGHFEESFRFGEKSLEALKNIIGQDNPTTLLILHEMGNALLRSGNLDKAFEVLNDVVNQRTRVLGESHPDTLKSQTLLFHVLVQKGDLPRALRMRMLLFEKMCASKLQGPAHSETIFCQYNTAKDLSYVGKYEEAFERFMDAFEKTHKYLLCAQGSKLTNEQQSALSMASNFLQQSEFSKALPLYNSTIKFSNSHDVHELRYLIIATYIGKFFVNCINKVDEGCKILEEMRTINERHRGNEHFITLNAQESWAIGLYKKNRFEESEKLASELVDIRKHDLRENHPKTLRARMILTMTLYGTGQYEDALREFRDIFCKFQETGNEMHKSSIETENFIGCTLKQLGHFEEARDTFRSVIKKRETMQGENHPDISETKRDLTDTLYAMRITHKSRSLIPFQFQLFQTQEDSSE